MALPAVVLTPTPSCASTPRNTNICPGSLLLSIHLRPPIAFWVKANPQAGPARPPGPGCLPSASHGSAPSSEANWNPLPRAFCHPGLYSSFHTQTNLSSETWAKGPPPQRTGCAQKPGTQQAPNKHLGRCGEWQKLSPKGQSMDIQPLLTSSEETGPQIGHVNASS